jgi:hypothetical protein
MTGCFVHVHFHLIKMALFWWWVVGCFSRPLSSLYKVLNFDTVLAAGNSYMCLWTGVPFCCIIALIDLLDHLVTGLRNAATPDFCLLALYFVVLSVKAVLRSISCNRLLTSSSDIDDA